MSPIMLLWAAREWLNRAANNNYLKISCASASAWLVRMVPGRLGLKSRRRDGTRGASQLRKRLLSSSSLSCDYSCTIVLLTVVILSSI